MEHRANCNLNKRGLRYQDFFCRKETITMYEIKVHIDGIIFYLKHIYLFVINTFSN